VLRSILRSLFRGALFLVIFCSWATGPSSAQICSAITVTPNSVVAGVLETLTFNANGMFDLSVVGPGQIGVDAVSFTTPTIINQTAQTLTFTMKIDTATAGVKTLFITDSTGVKRVALDLTVTLPPPPPPPPVCSPSCAATQTCRSIGGIGRCIPPICNPACGPDEFCGIDQKCKSLPCSKPGLCQ